MSSSEKTGRLGTGARLGRYTLLGLLGRGGMGEVHVAEDRERGGKRIALKVLSPAFAARPDAAARFDRERELLSRLSHPNVVPCLGPLETDAATGHAFFPMELVVGRSASELLVEHGPFDFPEALRLIDDVAAGLEAAHAIGLVHRDVKPSNVLVDRSGRGRLADFGLARAVDESRLTATGNLLGTPAYMAPEQAEGRVASTAADLYSLGALGYELVTGHTPFEASSPIALLRLHVDATPRPPRELRPDLPAPVEALLLKLLAKDPAARGTAASLRSDLAATFARVQPAAASAPTASWIPASVERETRSVALLAVTVLTPTPPTTRSRRRLAPIVFVAALVTGIAATGAWLVTRPPALRLARVRTISGEPRTGYVVRTENGAIVIRDQKGRESRVPLEDVEDIDYQRELWDR